MTWFHCQYVKFHKAIFEKDMMGMSFCPYRQQKWFSILTLVYLLLKLEPLTHSQFL